MSNNILEKFSVIMTSGISVYVSFHFVVFSLYVNTFCSCPTVLGCSIFFVFFSLCFSPVEVC